MQAVGNFFIQTVFVRIVYT